jgi:hypothetical protein
MSSLLFAAGVIVSVTVRVVAAGVFAAAAVVVDVGMVVGIKE